MSLIKDECVTLILHVTADGVQSQSRDGGLPYTDVGSEVGRRSSPPLALPLYFGVSAGCFPEYFPSGSWVLPPRLRGHRSLGGSRTECPRASQGPGHGTEPLAAHGGGGGVCSEEMKTQ